MSTGSRHDLVDRARGGDRKALEELIDRNLDSVYAFVAMKIGSSDPELEDLVQETLIGASGSLGRFRGDSEPAFTGWLLSIARFKVADHFRRRYASKVDFVEDSRHVEIAGSSVSAEDVVAEDLESQALRAALAELTPDQEEVLTLRFILGYDSQQVASMTGRPVGAVRALQHRGLATLRRRLGQEEGMWN